MRLIAVLCAGLLLLGGAARAAPPVPPVDRARALFERGEYPKVIDTLAPQLYPRILLIEEEEVKEAHYLLGVSFFYLAMRDRARDEFTALLRLEPTRKLEAATESPEVIAFFEGIKKDLGRQLEEIQRQRERDAAAKRQPTTQMIIETTIHEPSRWSNFVPFGYAQFRNGQAVKGVFFVATESLLAGASLSLFTYQAVTYGIPSRYPPATTDRDTIRALQYVQVGTGAGFLLAYFWQVVDGFYNQRPRIETKRYERPIDVKPKAQPQQGTLLITPLVAPQALGVGATWSF